MEPRIILSIVFTGLVFLSLVFFVAQRLRQLDSGFALIFTTNLDNEAPKGYHYQAFRFILKRRLEKDVSEAVGAIISREKELFADSENVTFKYKYEDDFDYITGKERGYSLFRAQRKESVSQNRSRRS